MNEFERLQREARAYDRAWVAHVKYERALYAAYEFAGVTPIEIRHLVQDLLADRVPGLRA